MSVAKPKAHGRTRKKRLLQRLTEKRAVKPCGKECRAWGYIVIQSNCHKSMVNSKMLVDDKEFLLKAITITPNPKDCDYFFYDYVNEYLKKDKNFRLEFLKNLFKNNNVLTKSDIEWFVTIYQFEKKLEMIAHDKEFYTYLMTHKPSSELPESFINWHNFDEKIEKCKSAKKYIRINDKLLARFDSLMECFTPEIRAVELQDEDDREEYLGYDYLYKKDY